MYILHLALKTPHSLTWTPPEACLCTPESALLLARIARTASSARCGLFVLTLYVAWSLSVKLVSHAKQRSNLHAVCVVDLRASQEPRIRRGCALERQLANTTERSVLGGNAHRQ